MTRASAAICTLNQCCKVDTHPSACTVEANAVRPNAVSKSYLICHLQQKTILIRWHLKETQTVLNTFAYVHSKPYSARLAQYDNTSTLRVRLT